MSRIHDFIKKWGDACRAMRTISPHHMGTKLPPPMHVTEAVVAQLEYMAAVYPDDVMAWAKETFRVEVHGHPEDPQVEWEWM